MKTTNFKVEERKMNKLNSVPYTGELNVDTFHFEFDEEWIDLEKTLIIIAEDKTYNVALLNDEAILPSEAYIDNKSISIGVFGKKENTILSTNLIDIWITKGAYQTGEEPSNLPTPTQWDLYVEEINNLLREAKVSEEECRIILLEVQTIQNDVEKAELNVETYNENHGQKMTEYNNNATAKFETYNVNATQKTSQFDANYTEKINSINDVESAVIDNINSKNTEFNTNATNKTAAFDENAEAKTTDFNANVENKKQELEDFSKAITIITSGTDDLIEGVSELPANSIYIVYE